jgi:hypothetical protein
VWKRFESSSGKPFWYNKYTKETTWRDPIAESCDDLQSQTVQVLEVCKFICRLRLPCLSPSNASLFLRPPLSTRVSPERRRCACDDRKRQEPSRLCFFKICQTAGCNASRGQRVLYIFKMSLLVNACGKPHIEAHCSEILWSNWEAYLLLTSWRCKGHRQRSTSAFTLPSQHALPLGLSPICWLANCSLVKCPKPR